MASSSVSSSLFPQKEKYDVFLSFRGEDTRQTFTSHLHAALIRRKVETYIDYRLERGDEVGPALLKAIKESKISVIIFSKDYASSTWCLDELAYILECKEKHGQYVIPVFYEIDPSHVRYQMGSYETAFATHEQRLKNKTDKVPKWKESLVKAANLSGFDSTSKTVGHDYDLVEQVVKDVLAKLNRESASDLTGLIGVEGRIDKILLELDIIPEDVRVRSLVIWDSGVWVVLARLRLLVLYFTDSLLNSKLTVFLKMLGNDQVPKELPLLNCISIAEDTKQDGILRFK